MSALLPVTSVPLLGASGFEYALQQPLFPGKIVLWLLFMLSLLSWAVMISKAVSFYRMRRADQEFDRRFRTSTQPLQLFERHYADELSMQWIVYEHGAHEAAFQLLGSPDRDATFESRLRSAGKMAPNQMKAVRDAFNRGEETAAARIRLGLPILSVAAAGAPFLGLLGMVWILMRTFSGSAAADGGMSAISPGVAGGLAVMVVALLVATPAIFGQILITAKGRERLRQLVHFKDEALRFMERFYLGESSPSREAADPAMEAEGADDENPAEIGADTVDSREAEDLVAPEISGPDRIETEADEDPGDAEEGVEDHLMEVEKEADEIAVQEEMPLNEIESPFEAVEEGFLEPERDERVDEADEEEPEPAAPRRAEFSTPFSEPEINPIAQQTAGLLAKGTI